MRYQWMTLKDVLRSLHAMDVQGVSEVARGKKDSTQTKEGFVEAYIATNGSIDRMEKRLTGRNEHETWSDRRNQFVSRHLEQMRKGDTYKDGWKPNGEPTRRHLGLIAWAYTPSPKRLAKWLKTQPKQWKPYVSNPQDQLSFDFRESDLYVDLPKDVVTEIMLAIKDEKDRRATVVIGNDISPKNPNVREAINLGYLRVVNETPHRLSGMTMYAIKPTKKAYKLEKERNEVILSQQEQMTLFNNPSQEWMDDHSEFMSSFDISNLEAPHHIEDKNKLRSIIRSMLKHGWKGRPFLAIGNNLLTGTHRHGAIISILNEYEDSENEEFIQKVEELGLSGHDNVIPVIDISGYLNDDDFEELEYLVDEEDRIKYLSSLVTVPNEIIEIYKEEIDGYNRNPKKSIVVPIHMLSKAGIHEKIGEIKLSDSAKGLRIDTDLHSLPVGYHGTHIHEYGSLLPSKKGSKIIAGGQAGTHYDPDGAGFHSSPNGDGHRGDLPKIHADEYGESKQTLYAPRLKLDEIKGRSIVIHRYGDNYSDHPLPNGGGKERMAGGVIIDICPHCRKNPVVRDSKGRKIPAKYLKGYTGKEREKRIKEIGRRRTEYEKAYEKYGDEQNFPQSVLDKIYRPFVTDKGKTTKVSSYTEEAHDRGFTGSIKNKAQKASDYYGGEIPVDILKDVYRRGVGAWPTGHRKKATPQQWGHARVNSFLVGGRTFITSDNDLAMELPKAVYNKIMKNRVEA